MSDTIDQSDDGLVFLANGPDDYDVEIPDSWLDDSGTRHAVVWDLNQERRYKWDAEDNRMILDTSIF